MGSLFRVSAIAMNTVREAVRNRLLYALLFFAVAMMCAGIFLAALAYVEGGRVLQNVGMSATRIFSVAIAIFVGVNLIHREVDRRTVYTILSKPLTRAEFLLGKFSGLVLTIWLQLAIMVAVFVAVSLLAGAPLGWGHVAAFVLIGAELVLIIAVATFFSAFTSPMLASFFSTGIWGVGHMTRDLREIGASSASEAIQTATAWLHRFLPDLESFNVTLEAVHGLPISFVDFWLSLVYAAGYTTLVLLASVAVFSRRDFR